MALPAGMHFSSTDNSYDYAVETTLSDTANFVPCRGLWVTHNNAGGIKVRMQNGDDVTFTWHSHATFFLPVRCTRVWETGTTAGVVVVAMY